MAMVNIQVVRMGMPEGRMGVLVRMWLVLIPRKVVGVLMMFIMNVSMIVTQPFVGMLVHVFFTQVQPDPRCH